jgi:branched-chain amino acid transport system ATP-binding protein
MSGVLNRTEAEQHEDPLRGDRKEAGNVALAAEEPIERLSLGQCRLVEVGRALMTEPKILLLDEPSSGLDRAETTALAQTLREVQAEQGFAILLVEHDVELVASFTTRSYVLDFGRMILEGPTNEVLASDLVRAAYLGNLEPTQ